MSAEARFRIGDRLIGAGASCLIVAELGANHNRDKQVLLDLVDAAAEAGADAIKLQTYTARELVSDVDRKLRHGPPGQEREETIAALFDRLAVPLDWHAEIFARAQSRSMLAFSTPFSPAGAEALDRLGVPAFKVAASDLLYFPLLSRIAATGKPVIISAGKCTLGEVEAAYRHLEAAGLREIAILHCVAQYPAPAAEMRLRTIPLLRQMFPQAVIGLSDHSLGIAAALGSVALGGAIIEKHFTLSKKAGGPDDWFSADPAEMSLLVREVRSLEAALPGVRDGVLPCEAGERATSVRSLVAAVDLEADAPISEAAIEMLRPGTGISPLDLAKVVGARPRRRIPKGTLLQWSDFR